MLTVHIKKCQNNRKCGIVKFTRKCQENMALNVCLEQRSVMLIVLKKKTLEGGSGFFTQISSTGSSYKTLLRYTTKLTKLPSPV